MTAVFTAVLSISFLRLPRGRDNWAPIAAKFEEVAGVPNVCGAIDGTLIEIERPHDHEGWYCRKGYPAINMQVVVDAEKRFMSYCIMPGSANDKMVLKESWFGRNINQLLPAGCHVLADSGYQLTNRVLTPFEITENMPYDEAYYNYAHSRTRICVEGSLGLLKS